MNNDPEPVVAVVVAAGSGVRLGADIPKALVELEGVPLVLRSLAALAAGGVERAVVVVPASHRDAFEGLLSASPVPAVAVVGGERRQDSVRAGLAALQSEADGVVVLVHDAARSLVPAAVVRAVAEAVLAGAEAVIPVLPVTDSVRLVDGGGSTVVDRSSLRAVQTPQGFRLGRLAAAHAHLLAAGLEVTDDAAAVEALGGTVTLVPGHRDALKVTEPVDLVVAAQVLAGRAGRA